LLIEVNASSLAPTQFPVASDAYNHPIAGFVEVVKFKLLEPGLLS
jgi:hypothetical protein